MVLTSTLWQEYRTRKHKKLHNNESPVRLPVARAAPAVRNPELPRSAGWVAAVLENAGLASSPARSFKKCLSMPAVCTVLHKIKRMGR